MSRTSVLAFLLVSAALVLRAWCEGAFNDPVNETPAWRPSAAQQREIERVYTEADLAR